MFGEGVRGVRRLSFSWRCAGKEGAGYEYEYSEFNHNPNLSVRSLVNGPKLKVCQRVSKIEFSMDRSGARK